MKKYILLTLSILAIYSLKSQQLQQNPYIYPLEGVARLYSGSFGEFRSGHFHSGVDIKTDGVEGKRVVAVADGYISRLGYSPVGFGLALYVTHPNGTTSVYAHLSRFRSDLNKLVREQRYSQQKHAITLFFDAGEYPVKQGELIAYSGNSGSSAGPHLHFEIRDAKSQRPQNIFAKGYITPRDTRRPIIYKLHYVEVDSVDGVAYKSKLKTFTTNNFALGQYSLKTPNNTISVGRRGYFILEAVDRKDHVTNSFGLYTVEGRKGGESFFNYRMDSFSFADSRYVNSVSDYGVSLISPREVLRLSGIECGTNQFYKHLVDGGVIGLEPAQRDEIEIVVGDDTGLSAVLKFNIVGAQSSFKAQVDTTRQIVRATHPFKYEGEGVRVSIPAKSLYESVPFECEKIESGELLDSMVVSLSRVYKVLDRSIPVHGSIELAIDVDVVPELQSHVALAMVSNKGQLSYAGGGYKSGAVVGSVRALGRYVAVSDSVPPVITPRFEVAGGLSSKSSVSFDVKDNFSGLKSYNLYIDDRWVALESRGGRLTHIFVESLADGEHTLRLEVEDGCGNIAVWESVIDD